MVAINTKNIIIPITFLDLFILFISTKNHPQHSYHYNKYAIHLLDFCKLLVRNVDFIFEKMAINSSLVLKVFVSGLILKKEYFEPTFFCTFSFTFPSNLLLLASRKEFYQFDFYF